MKVAYKITLPLVIVITIMVWFVTEAFNTTQYKIVKDGQSNNAIKITEQFDKNKKAILRNLEQNIAFTSNMIVEVSSKYLYDYDFEALENPLTQFLKHDYIKRIAIIEKIEKKSVAVIGEMDPKYKLLQKDIVWNDGQLLGYANIYYDDSSIEEYFKKSEKQLLEQIELNNQEQDIFINKVAQQRMYVNFSITLVVLVMLLLTIYITVIKPLKQLELGLASFFNYLQNKTDNVKRIEITTNDEFGNMGRELNENIAVTAKLHEEIHQLNYNLEEKITQRTIELEQKSKQIAELLNNAEEGFLSFGKNLLVDEQYSKECENIFQEKIASKNIADLLFKEDGEDKTLFLKVMNDAFDPKIKQKRKEVLLHLMAKEMKISGNYVKVEYKLISEDTMMLILVDITEKKRLEKKIQLEQKILKMIVSVVGDIKEFKELVNEYYTFCDTKEHFIQDEKTFMNGIIEYYRIIHTFKGNFAQKELVYIVPKLHSYEAKLNVLVKDSNRSFDEFKEMVLQNDLRTWLDKDIETINSILDQKLLEEDDTISVPESLVYKLEQDVQEIMSYPKDKRNITYEDLLEDVTSIRKRSLNLLMKSYAKSVEKLAKRLDKKLYPIEVVGAEELYVTQEIDPFIKSLTHIFRNSLDHGIESIDMRIEHGKDEKATINCDIEENDQDVVINIIDDGKGIDPELIKEKAIQKGLYTQEEIEKMDHHSILMIIFSDTFTTKEKATEISGRGVGLGAVKAEVEKLGGSIKIDTTPYKGTAFSFTIPLKSII